MKVVLANGVFDLLHCGHLTYLEYAKQLGDFLIVAVNSDASVRMQSKARHGTRPFIPEQERIRMVGAMWCVDRVVIQDDPTPQQLIAELRPDIWVLGGDHSMDLPIVSHARGCGVTVLHAFRDTGATSTTKIVRRILSSGEPE